jgi:hypothetical protein
LHKTVWHKTGTITGVTNDAGVINLGNETEVRRGEAVGGGVRPVGGQLVFVGFVEGLGRHGTGAGSRIISRSARLCYEAFANHDSPVSVVRNINATS